MKESKPSKPSDLNTSSLFRMPWTNSDNAFSWLEITHRCNLNCDYCYQKNRADSDKDLLQLERELNTLMNLRKSDTLFISGGEPLIHPQIVDIVRMAHTHHLKPVLVTNGHSITPEIIHTLKKAGVFGFVFHVDRGQSRPGWIDKTEKELNQLRQAYADMVHSEKGVVCGF
ncbi:MAG: radical SAM protein, partial [Proteobacteria bacterium]|nr:radical SAM protein [Pseudomonadota bacterium]